MKIKRATRFKVAQITAEYAILVTVIVAVLITMQIYVKRGLAARLKDAIDYPLTVPGSNFSTGQYEPDYYYKDSLSEQNSTIEESMERGGGINVSSTISSSTLSKEIINGTQ